jgi:hypothetical protein
MSASKFTLKLLPSMAKGRSRGRLQPVTAFESPTLDDGPGEGLVFAHNLLACFRVDLGGFGFVLIDH